jgi:hypothetical protein
MTLSPFVINYDTNMAFAGENDHDNDDGNSASPIIAHVQRSIQNSQVVSGRYGRLWEQFQLPKPREFRK